MQRIYYSFDMPGASHWSFKIRRGQRVTFTDLEGNANLAMLFYNPENLLEKYNAPDTLKCQHTFKLSKGHCLYSDMGRIFCSISEDQLGWHETVCGNTNKTMTEKKWGGLSYQQGQNQWRQNGYDSFCTELAKYGLGGRDLAANVNFFSKVLVDESGELSLVAGHSRAGNAFSLRFELDTLVLLHTCPHPLSCEKVFPKKAVRCAFSQADPVSDDDYCMNFCEENRRGFLNNELYTMGQTL